MKVVCAYCNTNMPDKAPFDNDAISHSICPECYEYFKEQWSGMPLDEYLDKFDVPVMILDTNCRIVAANEKAAKLTGKPRREVSGLLGGEALECAYSRLPGGCGRTVHCETCTVRKVIGAVTSTREPQLKVPLKIKREDKELHVKISVEMDGELVRIMIEP